MSNLASSSATNNDESNNNNDNNNDNNNNNNNNNNVSFSVKTLWKKYNRDVIFSLYSPFALSMAAGNLPQESFDKYKTQDSYYLNSYYQAYHICKEYGASNSKGVYEDIKLKCLKSAEKYDKKKEIPKDLPEATKNYINFLINTAKGTVEELNIILPPKTDSETKEEYKKRIGVVLNPKLPAFTLGAMTPCKRLYADLGTRLKEAMKNPTETITTTTETTVAAATTTTVTKTTETKTTTTINRYKNRWIDENASADTEESATKNEELVDRACKKMSENELRVVENLYKRSLKLEYEFFHAQLPTYQDSVIVPLLNKLKRDDQALNLHIIVEANAILAGDTYVYKSTYESDERFLFQDQILVELDASGFSTIFSEGGELNENLLNSAEQSMKKIKLARGEEVILQPYSIDFLKKVLRKKNISIHVIASGDRRGTNNVQANELNNDDNNSLTVVIGSSNCNWDQLPNANIRIKIIGQNSDVRLPEGFSATVPLFDGLVELQTRYFANSKQLSWNPKVLYTISSWAEVDASILGTY